VGIPLPLASALATARLFGRPISSAHTLRFGAARCGRMTEHAATVVCRFVRREAAGSGNREGSYNLSLTRHQKLIGNHGIITVGEDIVGGRRDGLNSCSSLACRRPFAPQPYRPSLATLDSGHSPESSAWVS
jgi:hypothetical protein